MYGWRSMFCGHSWFKPQGVLIEKKSKAFWNVLPTEYLEAHTGIVTRKHRLENPWIRLWVSYSTLCVPFCWSLSAGLAQAQVSASLFGISFPVNAPDCPVSKAQCNSWRKCSCWAHCSLWAGCWWVFSVSTDQVLNIRGKGFPGENMLMKVISRIL